MNFNPWSFIYLFINNYPRGKKEEFRRDAITFKASPC